METPNEKVKRHILLPFILTVFFLMQGSGSLLAGPMDVPVIGLISPESFIKSTSNPVIIDARPVKEWEKSHIPGAISLSWETYTTNRDATIPYSTLPPDQMAEILGGKGISDTSPIVIYGDADTSWGGEGWVCWLFTWLGHTGDIRLLDGGIKAWSSKHYPLETGPTKTLISKTVYTPLVRNGVTIETPDLKRELDSIQLIDTRSFLERIRYSIPGSVHIPWKHFYTDKTNKPLSPGAFKQLLAKHGINPEKPVVYFCTGGIRSAYAWTVHSLNAENSRAINYEGGVEAWKRLAN